MIPLVLGIAAGLIVAGYALWRIHPYWERIGASLLTRAGLAAAALILSLGAGIVFSTMLASIIRYLQVEKESDHLAYLAFGLLGVLAITMWSLHRLLGSKQALDVEFWKFKASMTQGDDPVPVEVVNKPSDPVPTTESESKSAPKPGPAYEGPDLSDAPTSDAPESPPWP